jgi:hypothetical protein
LTDTDLRGTFPIRLRALGGTRYNGGMTNIDRSIERHVKAAWQLLLDLPDGEREHTVEWLLAFYDWSELESVVARRRVAVGG